MSTKHPDTLAQLADLAAQGLSDGRIAEELGLTRSQVWYLRTREQIPASVRAGGAGRWHRSSRP